MKVTILGWYGTETIGDRGILLGLFKVFKAAYGVGKFRIGTFYPFYTERTLSEDMNMAEKMTGQQPQISLFNSRSPIEIFKAVRWADMVVIGGGPMMHFDPLYMFEFAIRLAKRLGKKTAMAACGVGPLEVRKMQRSFIRMADACDLVLLRDGLSEMTCHELFHRFGKTPPTNLQVTCDPAAFCAMNFQTSGEGRYTAVNLRAFPTPYGSGHAKRVNDWLVSLIHELADRQDDIFLAPMNHFHVGTDDRVFLHQVAGRIKSGNVTVTDHVYTLEETMRLFADAKLCIGMRFHSILFQTLLNGNNYILDYTDPKRGKIAGFVNEVDGSTFYADRYVVLQSKGSLHLNVRMNGQRFRLPENWLEDRFKAMVGHFKGLTG